MPLLFTASRFELRKIVRAGVLLLSGLIFSIAQAADQPDYEREARMANEIVDIIFDGEAEWLSDGSREFLSIYTEATAAEASVAEASAVAVIILHGRGFHPDWQDVVNPLRVGLAENGYATLSLQMPVLAKDAKYYDYVPIFPYAFPRIDAAIEFLHQHQYKRIVLLAHSCGVHMAMAWLLENGGDDIDGFIGLGMGATDYKQPMAQPLPLATLKVPILDLYGADEYPAVLRQAARRKAAIDQGANPLSAQQTLADANHYFTDKGDELLGAVTAWLNRAKQD